MEKLTLKEAEIGQCYKVKKITGEGPVKRRIRDMGLTKNTGFKVIKVAPLGDPIQIQVRGYQLSLRKDDAEIIEIEGIPEDQIAD